MVNGVICSEEGLRDSTYVNESLRTIKFTLVVNLLEMLLYILSWLFSLSLLYPISTI